jgi:D-amino-acid dehydrogenase
MISKLRALFPEAADYDQPTFWAGLRPMTPDGPPRIGKTRIPRLLVNTGQGHMGWTMACGSARILADVLAEKSPEIPMGGLELSRA